MAGRIRSIKPEILEDEKTANLSHLEWRIFVSSWLIADDYGNFRADPDYVRGQVLWASRESRESLAKALDSLASVSLLSLYRVRGQVYGHINGWDRHQKVDKPGKPRMPGPAEADQQVTSDSRGSRESLAKVPETPEPDLRPTTYDQDHLSMPAATHTPKAKARPAKTPLPADWEPIDSHRSKASELGLNCEHEAEQFRNGALAHARRYVDWDAAFHNWLGTAAKWRDERGGQRTPTTSPGGFTPPRLLG